MDNISFVFKNRFKVCDFTYGIIFKAPADFHYSPGQHISISIMNPVYTDDEGNSRYYSIANAPYPDKEVLIVMRESNSAFNRNLFLLKEGDAALIKGPEGNLTIHEDEAVPAVFIAGGLGVTPFRAIIEEELKKNSKRKIYLFYSNQTESSSAFLDEFKQWAESHPGFHFHPLINDINNKEWLYDYGLIDAQVIKKYLTNPAKNIFYIAGPPSMVEFVRNELLSAGAAETGIRYDKF
jgi:ferredoxin-NADP reductase